MKTNKWFKMVRLFLYIGIIFFMTSCSRKIDLRTKHIVFISGEEEYRSEESLPMMAKILNRETGAKVSICYSVDSLGFINPNISDNITGLERLKTADLMIVFARFRALPPERLKYIIDYVDSGKPIIGMRTSTHAFLYKNDSSLFHFNNEWPVKIFGQQWITHHGHFDDGKYPLTSVTLNQEAHPILRGVLPFDAYSWLYHVDGGGWRLQGDCSILLTGKSLKSSHQMEGNLSKYPLSNPVAWTKTYIGNQGHTARVFFTTLGHAYDFKNTSMRKLLLNSILWALGYENQIPQNGVRSKPEGNYSPNNSGFGDKYKKYIKPDK